MTKDKLVTAPVGTTLEEAERILARHRIEKLPVVDKDGVLRGLITVKDIFKRRAHPDANKDQHGRLRVGGALGAGGDTLVRAKALIDAGVDVLVVDSAHGHSAGVLAALDQLREAFPDAQLVGGNIATEEGAQELVRRGVDAVKVAIGPGPRPHAPSCPFVFPRSTRSSRGAGAGDIRSSRRGIRFRDVVKGARGGAATLMWVDEATE